MGAAAAGQVFGSLARKAMTRSMETVAGIAVFRVVFKGVKPVVRRIPGCIGIAVGLCGCGSLSLFFPPLNQTSVLLVNNSDYTVDVRLFYSDEQDIPEVLLTRGSIGTELTFTIPAGQSATFVRNCEDLQAIIIDQADLNITLGLGPEADTPVLRDGSDFRCGSMIVFTFDHSSHVLDFDITTTVQ